MLAAKAIAQTVEDPNIRERSKRLGDKIRFEDGVGRAVEFIEAAMFSK